MRFLTNAFLISKGKYKDFQIYAGFWVGNNNANSGIFIRCEDPRKPGSGRSEHSESVGSVSI